jgi:hypothetical protein
MTEVELAANGFIPPVVQVDGLDDLVSLLAWWLANSDAKTLGSLDGPGNTRVIKGAVRNFRFRVNADTRRDAVEQIVRAHPRGWRVVANARGNVNLVLPATEHVAIPGWYCYLTKKLPAAVAL